MPAFFHLVSISHVFCHHDASQPLVFKLLGDSSVLMIDVSTLITWDRLKQQDVDRTWLNLGGKPADHGSMRHDILGVEENTNGMVMRDSTLKYTNMVRNQAIGIDLELVFGCKERHKRQD